MAWGHFAVEMSSHSASMLVTDPYCFTAHAQTIIDHLSLDAQQVNGKLRCAYSCRACLDKRGLLTGIENEGGIKGWKAAKVLP